MARTTRPEGRITRGTTGVNRLRRVARWIAALPVLPAVLVGAVLIAAGWSLFVSVDVAIITQVLPSDRSTGSMLGVANIANALPQVIAPMLAAPIVTGLGGYPVLFLVTAAISLLVLVCVPRLRGVA